MSVSACMNACAGVFGGSVVFGTPHPHPQTSLPSQKAWVTGAVYSQAPSFHSHVFPFTRSPGCRSQRQLAVKSLSRFSACEGNAHGCRSDVDRMCWRGCSLLYSLRVRRWAVSHLVKPQWTETIEEVAPWILSAGRESCRLCFRFKPASWQEIGRFQLIRWFDTLDGTMHCWDSGGLLSGPKSHIIFHLCSPLQKYKSSFNGRHLVLVCPHSGFTFNTHAANQYYPKTIGGSVSKPHTYST